MSQKNERKKLTTEQLRVRQLLFDSIKTVQEQVFSKEIKRTKKLLN